MNFKHGGSYIDSSDWIKREKKKTINPIYKKNDKCFPYAVTVALINVEIKKDHQRITKIKTFIDKYSWDGMNYSSRIDD